MNKLERFSPISNIRLVLGVLPLDWDRVGTNSTANIQVLVLIISETIFNS